MNEPRTITDRVFDWDDDFTVPAVDFIAEMTKLLGTVPERFRNQVMINFDRTGSDYDFSRGELSMFYKRQETDDEARTRAQYAARSFKESEARERSELARLRAKYPEVR